MGETIIQKIKNFLKNYKEVARKQLIQYIIQQGGSYNTALCYINAFIAQGILVPRSRRKNKVIYVVNHDSL